MLKSISLNITHYLISNLISIRQVEYFTLADGQVAPGAIRVAGDGLDGKSRGESESGVALVGRGASEADVGGRDSEAVVNLRHRAAINLKSGVGC